MQLPENQEGQKAERNMSALIESQRGKERANKTTGYNQKGRVSGGLPQDQERGLC